jgi:hypothetical protein
MLYDGVLFPSFTVVMNASKNETVIRKFYSCFQSLDYQGMQACYHPDIRFADPVFPYLKEKDAGAMWHMLTETLKKDNSPWSLTVSNVQVDLLEGSCRWEAQYVFSLTGKMIHNVIDAKFKFHQGLIIEHTDYFNFYRWARMAFGVKGIMLGWTDFFKHKVQDNAQAKLGRFIEKNY